MRDFGTTIYSIAKQFILNRDHEEITRKCEKMRI